MGKIIKNVNFWGDRCHTFGSKRQNSPKGHLGGQKQGECFARLYGRFEFVPKLFGHLGWFKAYSDLDHIDAQNCPGLKSQIDKIFTDNDQLPWKMSQIWTKGSKVALWAPLDLRTKESASHHICVAKGHFCPLGHLGSKRRESASHHMVWPADAL